MVLMIPVGSQSAINDLAVRLNNFKPIRGKREYHSVFALRIESKSKQLVEVTRVVSQLHASDAFKALKIKDLAIDSTATKIEQVIRDVRIIISRNPSGLSEPHYVLCAFMLANKERGYYNNELFFLGEKPKKEDGLDLRKTAMRGWNEETGFGVPSTWGLVYDAEVNSNMIAMYLPVENEGIDVPLSGAGASSSSAT